MWKPPCNAGLNGQPAQEKNLLELGELKTALGKAMWDGPKQEDHPHSRACQYVNPYLTMGATISTGISQSIRSTGKKQVNFFATSHTTHVSLVSFRATHNAACFLLPQVPFRPVKMPGCHIIRQAEHADTTRHGHWSYLSYVCDNKAISHIVNSRNCLVCSQTTAPL